MKYEVSYKAPGTSGKLTVEGSSAAAVAVSALQVLREQFPDQKVSCSHPKPITTGDRLQGVVITKRSAKCLKN